MPDYILVWQKQKTTSRGGFLFVLYNSKIFIDKTILDYLILVRIIKYTDLIEKQKKKKKGKRQ